MVRRGSDPREVDAFLLKVASAVRTLEARLVEVEVTAASAAAAGPPDDGSDRLAESMAEIIAAAERQADNMVADARAEAGVMVSEAQAGADRIRRAAQDEADRLVEEARSLLERSEGGE